MMTRVDVSLPVVADVLPCCKMQGDDHHPQDLRSFDWLLHPSHIFFQGVYVARVGAEKSLHLGFLREVGMSMIWAAAPFMEAKGNARSQDKKRINHLVKSCELRSICQYNWMMKMLIV